MAISHKSFAPQEQATAPAEKSRTVRITTGAVDRDGEVLRPDGGQFEQYLKNPVVLFAHDYRSIPVGKCVSLTVDADGVTAKTIYNNTELAKEIYQLALDGFPLAVSLGFTPVETARRGGAGFQAQLDDCVRRGWVKKQETDGVRRIFSKWNLIEYSDVPVPANPEALQISISKGWLNPKKKGINMPVKKSGRVLSADNEAQLKKALEHHDNVAKCIKSVLDSVAAGDGDGDNDNTAPSPAEPAAEDKGITTAELEEMINQVMTTATAKQVRAASTELLAMLARSTGRHMEV